MRFTNFVFIFRFLYDVVHPSLTGDLSLVRYVRDIFHVLLSRTFVFGLRTKKPKYLKNLKPKNFFLNLRFFQLWLLCECRKRMAIIRIQWTKFDISPISSSKRANVSSRC